MRLRDDLNTEKMLNHRLQLQLLDNRQAKTEPVPTSVALQPTETSSSSLLLLKNPMVPIKEGVRKLDFQISNQIFNIFIFRIVQLYLSKWDKSRHQQNGCYNCHFKRTNL